MRQPPQPTVLVLPESAQLALIQMRDHLRLLATLTDTGTAASEHGNLLRPDALTWWFSHISRDLEQIIDAIHWSEDVARAAATRPA